MSVQLVATRPFLDQRPGTAGLRKKVRVFQQPHYLENFLQSIFDCVPTLAGARLVIGGDGRFHNREAIATAIAMAAANGVAEIVIGRHGLLSTPAASNLIRATDAAGGLLFTASHNPAGADGDFGLKFNIAGGGQAGEGLTERIYQCSKQIGQYRIVPGLDADIDRIGSTQVAGTRITVVDPVDDYAALMQQLFDFDRIRDWLRAGHRIAFDAMHAVTGPYAQRILVEQLGAAPESVLNGTPLADFGGDHPDPNLVYGRHLWELAQQADAPDLIAASDGDGDRNMILGRGILGRGNGGAGTFVSPGDSLAMLAAALPRMPGYRDGIAGIARSMPTSRAADRVAAALKVPLYETPTGWKFFANLLDSGHVTVCGEESFGTSSRHVREKDGLWAVLAWLNLLALEQRPLAEVCTSHWQQHGRHYFQRHDYEALPPAQAEAVMQTLAGALPTLPGQTLGDWTVTAADEFSYHDPVDGSLAVNQGLRVICGEDARFVMRMSGTGTDGATLRIYLERYVTQPTALHWDPAQALAPLAAQVAGIARMAELTGRNAPDLAT